MIKQIESIKATRNSLLNLISDLSVEELNEIPSGFNNNIIWNIAHLVASQQGVCYKRAGLGLLIDDVFFMAYKPGTKPEHFVDTKQIDVIKGLLLTTIDQFETDLKNNVFINYPSWVTRYGVELKSIDDAIIFLPFHEGLHFGYIMALKRVLK